MRASHPVLLVALLLVAACSSQPGPDPESTAPHIEHSPVLTAVEATEVLLEATVTPADGEELPEEMELSLHHRGVGTESYTEVPMDEVDGTYLASIPGDQVTVDGVEYFLALLAEDAEAFEPSGGEELPHRIVVSSAPLLDPAPLRAHYSALTDSVELTWTATASSAFVGYSVSARIGDEEPQTVCQGGQPDPGCSVAAAGIYDQDYATWTVTVADNEGSGLTAEATTDGLHLPLETWGKEVTPESPLASGSGEGEFSLPFGVVTTPSRIHIIEQGNHRLQSLSNTGLFLSYVGASSGAGVPGDQPGEFNSPHDVALGGDGALYIADHSNARIQVIDSENSQILSTFGELGDGEGQLRFPISLDLDPEDGTLHVLESVNARVSVFDPASGEFLESYDTIDGHTLEQPKRIAWLDELGSMAVADGGSIYLASRRDDIEDDSWEITSSETAEVAGMCTSEWGEIWVTIDDPNTTVGSEGHRLLKLDSSGELELELGEWGIESGQLWRPVDCDVSSEGELFVVEGLNHRVQLFGP